MNGRALSLDVRYARDGEHEGSLFVSRRNADLELTTPAYIIRLHQEQAFELWTELHRLFGWEQS
jgi:hypothetical protein